MKDIPKLQQLLEMQFGQGFFLTNRTLDWQDCIDVRPWPRAAFAAVAAPEADRLMDPKIKHYGEGALSVGFNNCALSFPPALGISVSQIIVKMPGSDTYRLPRQLAALAPVLAQMAGHEHAINPNAHGKYARIIMRRLPLLRDATQITENQWHTHPVIDRTALETVPQLICVDAKMVCDALGDVSMDVVQSEYLFSDCASSLVQTQVSPYFMNVRENGVLVMPPAHRRQVSPREVVRVNSYVYHAASKVTEADIGRDRTLLLLTYTATPAIERAVRAQQRQLVMA